MQTSRLALAALALCATALARAQGGSGAVAPETLATDKIRDLSASLRIVHEELNAAELKKMGGAFATSYRIPRYDVFYKNPNKARFEGKAGLISGVLIYNGDVKKYKAGPIKKTENTKGHPGSKQSLMDLGIFAKDWLATDYKAVFLRRERELVVFKLIQRDALNDSHEIVWVDPKTHVTVRRTSMDGSGKLRKELRYLNPKQFAPGVYFPTRVELYNQFGKKAGAQTLEGIRVNMGVPDDKFQI